MEASCAVRVLGGGGGFRNLGEVLAREESYYGMEVSFIVPVCVLDEWVGGWGTRAAAFAWWTLAAAWSMCPQAINSC